MSTPRQAEAEAHCELVRSSPAEAAHPLMQSAAAVREDGSFAQIEWL